MSSQLPVLIQNLSLKAPQTPLFASTQKYADGVSPFKPKDNWVIGGLSLKCNAMHKPRAQGIVEIVQDEPVVKELVNKDDRTKEIRKHVDTVRLILNSMGDGAISTSAYDAAWVAMVKNVNGTNTPQFPSSLQWIINNQLEDGSWGDKYFFSTYDRILNTLACIVALKYWNVYSEKFEKGFSFMRDNMYKLEKEKVEHMPIGFEIVFPTLLEIAEHMGIEVPNDSLAIKEIYARKDLKFKKIPKEMLHSVRTGLLYSLEGVRDLEWEKLLKLQFEDGSFFWCPSSTAYAFMQTNDDKCLNFLNDVVQKFNGAVPNIYPVDLFERMWGIDRLQRLGISRYFEPEIKELAAYIYRYWNETGLGGGRNAPVTDVDDTAMGFRVLRLHGYDVSPDVFKQFEKGDEFVCMAGQASQAVTGLFNLYRAAQCLHPGEKIFDKAKKFCSKFLREKRACNQLYDKWIVSKDLPNEVGYALDIPWYASLPRLEARFYVEHYGGGDDVWIGKVLYRMYHVNNDTYLELAKLDYNQCQELHQLEWNMIQKWWMYNHLQGFGISRETLLSTYFLAAASIFEPERSVERMAWAKAAVLVEAVADYFSKETCIKQRVAFLLEFGYGASGGRYKKIYGNANLSNTGMELVGSLLTTLNQLSFDAQEQHGSNIRPLLHHTWEMWLTKNLVEEDEYQLGDAELMVDVINLCSGRSINEEVLSNHLYKHLAHLTNSISHQLTPFYKHKAHNGNYCPENDTDVSSKVEPDMQELAQLVFQNSFEDIDSEIKKTFITVAKSFYYAAYCDASTIDSHIAKVLFERVVV